MAKTNSQSLFSPLGYGRRLLLLALMFFVMLVLTSFGLEAAKQIYHVGTREYIMLASTLQALIMFVAPAMATAFFLSRRPFTLLGLNRVVKGRAIIGILLIFLTALPALNQTIWWNSNISFPDWMSSVEQWVREMEASASAMQNTLMSSKSIGGLLSAILVVGIITGFAEEIFFRGALQRVIGSNGMNPHYAIWISAFIFSLLHFQFFGFLPRLLLGAFFGYIFYWTGSIWASALAHALNNSIVVITTFLAGYGYTLDNVDQLGVVKDGFPVWALISVVVTACIIVTLRKFLFTSKSI